MRSSKLPERDELLESMALACDWLVDVAQIKTEQLTFEKNNMGHKYVSWKGAIRGEYRVSERRWGFFCPVWHTGQAVRALLRGADLLNNDKYRQAAKMGMDFILDKQVWNPNHPDHGLILAYEDNPDKVNTSAMLEGMAGLMDMADQEKSRELWNRIMAAGDFLLHCLFIPEQGVFSDAYDPVDHKILPPPYLTKDGKTGRPLLDDAVFARIYDYSGRAEFLEAQVKISETLVADQQPRGNWMDYAPCDPARRLFHPRHTYWWGLPLLDTFRLTSRQEFLDTALASGDFCRRAMRHDGGWVRGLYLDPDGRTFNTDCFGHATSGSACAAILFMALYRVTRDCSWLSDAEKCLVFCRAMQFTEPEDPNLKGAVLEKVFEPCGSDASPFYIRDVGTIFYVMALGEWMTLTPGALP